MHLRSTSKRVIMNLVRPDLRLSIVAKIRKRLHKKYKLAPLFANSTFYIKDECPIKTVEIKRRIEPYDSEDNSTRELGINTVDQNISPESNKIVYRKRKK
uniref:Uncharacterized protein n=1 Tax=Euplotes crassus TaxID=5936 RepID=A0A7S3NX41_EUPCR|mmetsp:Transcript_28963/g.28653  ORF Transcript_28963/g.28653 Transcript_28963/m.28653 type:complete len:100 (+) Transcript_28963:85-384(+)